MYMGCGRPIFAVATGETRRVIEEAGAGVAANPDSKGIAHLADLIGGMRTGASGTVYGKSGREYALRHCTWQMIAGSYETVLKDAARSIC